MRGLGGGQEKSLVLLAQVVADEVKKIYREELNILQ